MPDANKENTINQVCVLILKKNIFPISSKLQKHKH